MSVAGGKVGEPAFSCDLLVGHGQGSRSSSGGWIQ